MKTYNLNYRHYSRNSILVEWPAEICQEILQDMLLFKSSVLQEKKLEDVQLVNAYHAILIIYNGEISNYEQKVAQLKSFYQSRSQSNTPILKLWKIPVCYDPVFGIDLVEISKAKQRNVDDIIRWHSEVVYQIYFIGFLPGFLYLGGLDPRLAVARKDQPRQQIEKGAVAIGGGQTGIYPNASPGGWNIIGNSPIEFFNPLFKSPCFATAGDHIQFVPISLDSHQEIASKIKKGTYSLEQEINHG